MEVIVSRSYLVSESVSECWSVVSDSTVWEQRTVRSCRRCGDDWRLSGDSSWPTRAGSVLSESWARVPPPPLRPLSSLQCLGQWWPDLHGDAAAGGASKIDLRTSQSRSQRPGRGASGQSQTRPPPASQTGLGMRRILINLYLPAMTGGLREHFSLITI